MRKRAVFLVGPTGSGKTKLSISLAKRLGCEIVSADSMLVYRGMDIGTAKPTPAERREVRHHLIDLVSPRTNYSVFRHRKQVLKVLEDIHQRGKIPLVVGGSGLYLDALLRGLSPHPGGDLRFRKRFESFPSNGTTSRLYRRLQKMDPERAHQIHPHDQRRILRALEIARSSGKRPSEWYRQRESLEDLGYSVRLFGIQRDRKDLYERINRRVETMFRKGFVKEVQRLRKKGFSKTAGQALGYREMLDSFVIASLAAERPDEAISLIQTHTRQFAKRQLTWLKREKAISWIRWRPDEPCTRVCDKIVKEIRKWQKTVPCLSSVRPQAGQGACLGKATRR